MKVKDILNKPMSEITDKEFKHLGSYFLKHPEKMQPSVKLHKCISCKNLLWYDYLGEDLWECLKNPCNDLATESDKLLNRRMITHQRKCEDFKLDTESILLALTL